MPNYSSQDVFILHEFNENTRNLRLSNESLTESIGIASTLPSIFKQSCGEIDQEILDKIDEINEIKREIIEISQRAYNNVTGITSVGITPSNAPNVAPFNSNSFEGKVPNDETGTDWYSCKVGGNTSNYDRYNFIAPGTVETFDAYRGEVEEAGTYYICNGIPQVNPCPVSGIQFIGTQEEVITYKRKLTTITRAPVYPDTLRAWFFENLEDLNSNVLNPLEPAEYQTLAANRNNLGIGKTSNLFFNQEFNGVRNYNVPERDQLGRIESTPNYTSSLGFFYDITGPSDIPAHVKDNSNRNEICGIRAQIDPLMARINGLRARVTELATGVSAIKDEKTDAQLAEWSLTVAIQENNRRIGINSLAISAIEDKYD